MARSQSQIGLICETLLSVGSDERRSLQGVNTDGLIEGNRAFAVDVGSEFRLDPESTLAQEFDKIITAPGGGNWLLCGGGDDPVDVYTLGDLPASVGGVITLLSSITYRIHGELNLLGDRIVMSAGSGLEGTGIALLVTSNTVAAVTCTTGTPARIHNLAITNNGTGPGVTWDGDGDGSQLWMHDCSIYGAPALDLTGVAGDSVYVYDCRFYGVATSWGVELSDAWSAVSFVGCRFLGDGDGMRITSGEGTVANLVINGCEFSTPTGKTGVTQNTADAVVQGRLVGNLFWGAGTPIDGNVATTEWIARGNTAFADF